MIGLMYILRNNPIKNTTYTILTCLIEAKSKIQLAADQSHFFLRLFCILRLHYSQFRPSTRCITEGHAHHSGGQEHLSQLSPSCSCWRLVGSITLRRSLYHLFLLILKGKASLFSPQFLVWMTPSGPPLSWKGKGRGCKQWHCQACFWTSSTCYCKAVHRNTQLNQCFVSNCCWAVKCPFRLWDQPHVV